MKRRQLTYLAIGLTALLSFPYVLAILHRWVITAMVLQFVITLLGVGLLHGLAPILTSEAFPTKFRYSGGGISYSLSAIFGGMCAPPLLAALIGQDVAGKWIFVPAIYCLYAIVAFIALRFIPETRDIALEQLDGVQLESDRSRRERAASV